MFHRWQIILGLLVYKGQMAPSPSFKSKPDDFLIEDKETPHTVFVRVNGQRIPLFHPSNSDHAKRLKADHTLQSGYSYVE